MESTGVKTVSYATIENGEVATVRTVAADEFPSEGILRFQAASISKPVSALAILRFVEQRGLDLDADINEYLTSWKVDYTGFEDAPRVTIRRLLSHRAGLNVHGFPGYGPSAQIPSTLDVLEGRGNTDAITLFQAPATGFSYSGGGYTVLQMMVEDQTGESFAEFMEREVLRPLGMVDSHFDDAPGGPYPTAKDGKGEHFDVPYHVYPEKAAAALWTTAPDLARFLIATDTIIDGKMTDFLSAELAAQMLVVPAGEGGETYALGFDVVKDDTHDVFQHSGANFGYKSIMYFDRASKTGLVALSDSDRGFVINSMLARGRSRADGLDFMSQRREVPVAHSKADWSRIEGVWTFADGPGQGRQFRFTSEGEADLYAVEIATGEVSRMVAIGPMEFLDTETISPLVFSENDNGNLEATFAVQYRMVRVD